MLKFLTMDGELIIPLDEDGANANFEELADLQGPLDIEKELEHFRVQWQKELVEEGTDQDVPQAGKQNVQSVDRKAGRKPTIEEEARYLFLQGVNAEQCGRLYEAIRYYRRAVQLVPDIEFRIEEFKPRPRLRGRYDSTSSVETSDVNADEDDLDNLISHFHKLLNEGGAICNSDNQSSVSHISRLPVELLMYIFKWVVSPDLDVASLEELALVCRGFYLCARDEEIWRLICYRIWGLNCGSPTNYGCYRNMYRERPHLRYNGCYISKCTYYRQGEQSLDNLYRPFQTVEYCRFIRFFPEGKMIMLTSPDDPQIVVGRLKERKSRIQGVQQGYYRMSGDKVTAVLKRRRNNDNSNYRYRRRRQQQQNDNQQEQSFHVEFRVCGKNKRPYYMLEWIHYSLQTVYKATGQENIAEFELTPQAYPPLVFSQVKSYTQVSESPLEMLQT